MSYLKHHQYYHQHHQHHQCLKCQESEEYIFVQCFLNLHLKNIMDFYCFSMFCFHQVAKKWKTIEILEILEVYIQKQWKKNRDSWDSWHLRPLMPHPFPMCLKCQESLLFLNVFVNLHLKNLYCFLVFCDLMEGRHLRTIEILDILEVDT